MAALASAGVGIYSAMRGSGDSGGFNAANAFNAEEAAKQRAWQEYMYKNRHQMEVADLIAAGLNPILSAGGQPPVPSANSAHSVQPAMSSPSERMNALSQAVMSVSASAKSISEIGVNAAQAANLTQDTRTKKVVADIFTDEDFGKMLMALKQMSGPIVSAGAFLGGLGSSAKNIGSLFKRRYVLMK